MDPITVALGLAQFVPQVLKYFGASDKQADVAAKVIDVAKAVTGKSTGEDALAAMQVSSDLQLKFQESLLSQELELAKLSASTIVEVNKTMQSEAASEHWPTYSWRPFIGFSFGAWINSVWLLPLFKVQPVMLTPEVMLAIGSILGVASWFRGKMQADPAVPTTNKG